MGVFDFLNNSRSEPIVQPVEHPIDVGLVNQRFPSSFMQRAGNLFLDPNSTPSIPSLISDVFDRLGEVTTPAVPPDVFGQRTLDYQLGQQAAGHGYALNQAITDWAAQNPFGQQTSPYDPVVEGAGMLGRTDFDALHSRLEGALSQLVAARDAAVRKSGSAAAAKYNDAIAAVQDQIAQVEEAKRQIDTLYGGQISFAQNVFGQAADLADYGGQALANQDVLSARLKLQRQEDFDKVAADTQGVLSRIGVDKGTANAVTAKVKEMQNEIMDSDEVTADLRKNVIDASAKLAVAAAKYSGAKTVGDLARRQAEVQLGLDQNLNDLLKQKDDLIKARNRAAAAARSAAAAQYEGLIPKNAQEYAQWHVSQFLKENGTLADPALAQIVFGLVSEAANPLVLETVASDANGSPTQLAHGATSYSDVEKLLQEHVALGDLPGWSANSISRYAPLVWQAVQVYRMGYDIYNTEIAGADPETLVPGTVDRVASNYYHAQGPNIPDSEVEDYATSEAANSTYVGGRVTPVTVANAGRGYRAVQ